MFNSVRTRLTLWYALVLAVLLVFFALATYFVARQNFIRRTDSAAVEQADAFLRTVNAEMHDPSSEGNLQEGIDAAISEHRYRDTGFAVLDQSGAVLADSENLESKLDHRGITKLWEYSVKEGGQTKAPFHTVHIRGQKFRSYVRLFSVEHKDCALLVLQSLHPEEEFLETLAGTFAVVIPIAILLASIGGYFLARRSLSPVATMGAQAEKITADNLHERLKVENPEDEVGKLAQSFNELLDRLDRSFEQERRFIADASHELRTPVAILCGETDVTLLQPSRSAEEYRESLGILRIEARRLKRIVEDLFTLARADAGQRQLQVTNFYLDELVAECIRSMRSLASAKGIALNFETPGEMPIQGDESLLRRMFINLLDNAIKHTASGGSVTADCVARDSHYFVSIKDTGVGIPAEMHIRIFERFFRVDKARSRSESDGGGAGLGLPISRWIAESHGGSLELTHSDPTGSTFTVRLRLCSPEQDLPAN